MRNSSAYSSFSSGLSTSNHTPAFSTTLCLPSPSLITFQSQDLVERKRRSKETASEDEEKQGEGFCDTPRGEACERSFLLNSLTTSLLPFLLGVSCFCFNSLPFFSLLILLFSFIRRQPSRLLHVLHSLQVFLTLLFHSVDLSLCNPAFLCTTLSWTAALSRFSSRVRLSHSSSFFLSAFFFSSSEMSSGRPVNPIPPSSVTTRVSLLGVGYVGGCERARVGCGGKQWGKWESDSDLACLVVPESPAKLRSSAFPNVFSLRLFFRLGCIVSAPTRERITHRLTLSQ